MAEGGSGEAGEEAPRAAGPRPPSARDLQVRRAMRLGNVWGRSGRGRASSDPPGDRTRTPWVSPGQHAGQGRREKGVSAPRALRCPGGVSPPPLLPFKKQLLIPSGFFEGSIESFTG